MITAKPIREGSAAVRYILIAGGIGIIAGIAVMPDIPILRSLSVKTLDIYNPPYERAVYLATLKQRYLSPVAKASIRFVIEETA